MMRPSEEFLRRKHEVPVKDDGITVLSRIQAEPAEFLPQSETEFFPTVDWLGNIKFAMDRTAR